MDSHTPSGQMLVIEDDPDISLLICEQLKDLGITTAAVASGEVGLQRGLAEPFIGFVIDLMLPGMGGFEICRRLRAANVRAPIMIMTSKSETIDKVMGFDAGADDFMTKPFDVLEFSARIRALLRRAQQHASPSSDRRDRLQLFELMLDPESRQVKLGQQALDLTRTEFDVLQLLMSHPGRVFSREDLVQEIWGSSVEAYAENITTHVSRLRMKLAGTPDYSQAIVTVRGAGYRLVDSDEWTPSA